MLDFSASKLRLKMENQERKLIMFSSNALESYMTFGV
jgi:hypothetical protein